MKSGFPLPTATSAWAGAIAGARHGCGVFEPDVSPLAIQGLKSHDVVADLVATDSISAMALCARDQWHSNDRRARAGRSREGMSFIFDSRGEELWRLVAEAGAPYE